MLFNDDFVFTEALCSIGCQRGTDNFSQFVSYVAWVTLTEAGVHVFMFVFILYEHYIFSLQTGSKCGFSIRQYPFLTMKPGNYQRINP